MKFRWIIHKDKRIFIADYSDLGKNLDTAHIEIAAVIEMLSQEPLDSVLAVTDVSYTYATDVQSLTGSKQYRMFNRMREALDWLTSE